MATRAGNIKDIVFHEGQLGSEKGGYAVVSFDLVNTVFTGGSDTITLGGGGTDEGASTSLTLAQIMQNRLRNGKTVTLLGTLGGPFPGAQAAATNGPNIFPQGQTVSSGNITSITLNTAYTGGSAVTTTAAAWDRAASIIVNYTAS